MFYLPYLLIISSALSLEPGNFSVPSLNCDDLRIDYRVENSDSSSPTGEIHMKVLKGTYPITFKLYDLHDGSYKFSDEKTIYSDDKAPVFEKLPASEYVVQVVSSRCTITLGGIEGIKISRKQ